jgi:GNAT superfamily N-acetyltransferase
VESQPAVRIEPATPADVPVILELIRELASFERLLHEVVAEESLLREHLFGAQPYAEVVLARTDNEVVGFALFFHNYSTFKGRPGVYLEDLYVRDHCRGHGYGAALLRHVAKLAVSRGCARFEWSVLDWNQRAIDFYRALGAEPLNEWTMFRVSGAALEALAR